MTIFGWDASHYDGTLTTTILQKAKDEGIVFFTHKIGQGLSNTDTTQATALSAAKAVGIPILGGYYYLEDGDEAYAVKEADRCVTLANQYESWWRDFPLWFWQTDAERDSNGVLVRPASVKAFSDRISAVTGRLDITYASRGMYGDRLIGLGHPLWNADYGSNPVGAFKDVYPGDNSRGWTAYSGQTPLLLQYGSNTKIAGLTTCDANAFRGTLAELTAIIEGDDMATVDVWNSADVDIITPDPAVTDGTNLSWRPKGAMEWVINHIHTLILAVTDLQAKVAALPTTAAPAAPLSDADVARIAVAVLDEQHRRDAS